MNVFKKYLNSDKDGFSGLNHVLIAIMLFLIILLMPIPTLHDFFNNLLNNPVTGIISFLCICGGALLPDMDNLKKDGGSAATWDLGIVGSIISTAMVTLSSIVTSICHGKKDVKPMTQHRFLWHTLFIPAVMFLIIVLCVPDDNTPIIDLLKNISLSNLCAYIIISLLFIAICVYIGLHILLKKISKILPFNVKHGIISGVVAILSVIFIAATSSNHDLKIFDICIILGYLFHLLGDMFADGGIPALFPITGIFGKFFMRIKLSPITVTTGSVIESMLKVVFAVIDIILFYFVFISPFV